MDDVAESIVQTNVHGKENIDPSGAKCPSNDC
jgi:hypothetical protein